MWNPCPLNHMQSMSLAHTSEYSFVTFLACPSKVTQRRAPGWSFDIDPARSSSVRFENSPFGQVKLSGLEQFETFNPRTRSHSGKDRMGKDPERQKPFPKPARPWTRPYEIPGHPSWPKGASRRADAHCPRATGIDAVGETELRGRASAAVDGSGISFRTRKGCAKKPDHRTVNSCQMPDEPNDPVHAKGIKKGRT
jgi:hypothetical protein